MYNSSFENVLQNKMHSMLTETSFVCVLTIIGKAICGSINAIYTLVLSLSRYIVIVFSLCTHPSKALIYIYTQCI